MQQTRFSFKSIVSIISVLVLLIVTILSCTEGSYAAAPKFKISSAKKYVYIGKSVKLKSNKNVKWTITKGKKCAKLISVKKKSVSVKGIKVGTVYVTAKAGKQTKKIKLTVRSRVPKSIKLATTREVVGIGESCTVSVESVTPSYASTDVEFSSSDASKATVNSVGFVTGLKQGTVTITATSKKSKKIKGRIAINVVDARSGVLSVLIDMTDSEKYPPGKAVKAWFQVPVSDENQRITNVDHTTKDDKAACDEIVTDSSGAQAYFVEWGPEVAPEDRVATLSFHVYRRAVLHSEDLRSMEKGDVDAGDEDIRMWLRETQYSGSLTNGIVKKTADKAIEKAESGSVYDRAHAIYLWVCDNINRDKKMPNRELGDVVTILSSTEKKAGSCIDINSIFVALCNAEGIPARESFGYKIFEGSSDENTQLGQNCRAEFYLPGYGWVEVDPAMPLGLVMRGQVEKGTVDWENEKEKYWVSGSPEWICQNHGRDLTFESPAGMNAAPGYMVNPDGSLNHFMFPFGEYDGQFIPGWGDYPSEFKYKYTFEGDMDDCGC